MICAANYNNCLTSQVMRQTDSISWPTNPLHTLDLKTVIHCCDSDFLISDVYPEFNPLPELHSTEWVSILAKIYPTRDEQTPAGKFTLELLKAASAFVHLMHSIFSDIHKKDPNADLPYYRWSDFDVYFQNHMLSGVAPEKNQLLRLLNDWVHSTDRRSGRLHDTLMVHVDLADGAALHLQNIENQLQNFPPRAAVDTLQSPQFSSLFSGEESGQVNQRHDQIRDLANSALQSTQALRIMFSNLSGLIEKLKDDP